MNLKKAMGERGIELEEWVKVGSRVDYHSRVNGPITRTGCEIESEPWEGDKGEWFVLVIGISGGVPINKLTQSLSQGVECIGCVAHDECMSSMRRCKAHNKDMVNGDYSMEPRRKRLIPLMINCVKYGMNAPETPPLNPPTPENLRPPNPKVGR